MTLLKFSNPLVKQFDTRPMFAELYNDLIENFNPGYKINNMPSVNIHETDDKFNVSLAAPGLKKEDFKIGIENGVLIISAEKKDEKTETQPNYSRKEFSYETFSRSFTLPEVANTEAIAASYENGVLSIDIPKREKKQKNDLQEIKIS
jgi:HSP20 family protein